MKKILASLPFFTAFLCFSSSVAAQRVGINTTNPQTPLHVAGTSSHIIRMDGINPYLSVYNDFVYKGYLWYNTNKLILGTSSREPVVISAFYNEIAHFTDNGRVGINTSSPTERLDVNGGVNLKTLSIDGDKGIAGQALVSGGASQQPKWKSVAYQNNTRFCAEVSRTGLSGPSTYTQIYNRNTADITINSNSITVIKAGFYHLDGFVASEANFPGGYMQNFPPSTDVYFYVDNVNYYGFRMSNLQNNNCTVMGSRYFNSQVKFSYDIYIEAGKTLYLGTNLGGGVSGGTFSTRGQITGHLISE